MIPALFLPAALASASSTMISALPERFATATEDPDELGATGQIPEALRPSPDVIRGAVDPRELTGAGPPIEVPEGPLGIPEPMLFAYVDGAGKLADTTPGCGVDWAVLASIGRIESAHARSGEIDVNGTTVSAILGPRLNGGPSIAAIRDTDNAFHDGDPVWDRAVGPMQFIPSTWSRYAVDGNDDRVASPHNVHDSITAAGNYLCAAGTDLRDPGNLAAAVFTYNQSDSYVREVLIWADAYRRGVNPLPTELAPPDERDVLAGERLPAETPDVLAEGQDPLPAPDVDPDLGAVPDQVPPAPPVDQLPEAPKLPESDVAPPAPAPDGTPPVEQPPSPPGKGGAAFPPPQGATSPAPPEEGQPPLEQSDAPGAAPSDPPPQDQQPPLDPGQDQDQLGEEAPHIPEKPPNPGQPDGAAPNIPGAPHDPMPTPQPGTPQPESPEQEPPHPVPPESESPKPEPTQPPSDDPSQPNPEVSEAPESSEPPETSTTTSPPSDDLDVVACDETAISEGRFTTDEAETFDGPIPANHTPPDEAIPGDWIFIDNPNSPGELAQCSVPVE